MYLLKSFKNLFYILLTFVSVFLVLPTANAVSSTVNKLYENGTPIMYNRYEYDWNNYMYEHMEMIFVEGKAAYCIEPGAPVGPTYSSGTTDWNATGLSQAIKHINCPFWIWVSRTQRCEILFSRSRLDLGCNCKTTKWMECVLPISKYWRYNRYFSSNCRD